jgi:class 3 adenylate cyclase
MSEPGSSRILVVDDTTENLQVIGAILRKAGYQLSIAKLGQQGLDIAARTPPDLVLLDIMMPEMDGFEVCRRFKADPRLKEIPIIFLTASNEAESVVKGFELGAVDYITKPFNAAELLSRVNTHLQLRAARRQLEELASKLSRYLSPQVYKSIFSGEKDVKIETYQRKLTVFFSDIVGFTAKTESMGDQELTQWLNGYLDEMARIADKHGGTLDKFIGDAVMVFFGDPETDGEEGDAVKCLHMAVEMLAAAGQRDIAIRIGINSGDCVVGNFGSETQMDYTIIGKVVNAASRLQSSSEAGRILISDATRQLIQNEIECEKRGPIELRGIPEPMMSWWVKT